MKIGQVAARAGVNIDTVSAAKGSPLEGLLLAGFKAVET